MRVAGIIIFENWRIIWKENNTVAVQKSKEFCLIFPKKKRKKEKKCQNNTIL